jgi:hypothetical protein
MAQLNANTPYIQCYIRKEHTGLDENLFGYIFGVKSLLNHPLLFHFQGKNGVVVWNCPITAFCWKEDYDKLSDEEETRLQLLESWDAQSNSIAVTTFKFLENKKVDVYCRDKQWRSGVYYFTIDDYSGDENEVGCGYSNDADSKCFHFIALDCGNYCIQPNNLLRWHNPDFIIPYDKENPPKLRVVSEYNFSEHMDRTYGNSPYQFYTHYENEDD